MATSTASGPSPARVRLTSVLNMQRLTMSRVTRIISVCRSTTAPVRYRSAMCAICSAAETPIVANMPARACLCR